MANPTTIVPATRTKFIDTKRYWPIDPAILPYRFVTNQLMGADNAGYATNCDDTQPIKFLGLWTGIQFLIDSTVPPPTDTFADRPQFIDYPLNTGSASRITDLNKPVFAADAGHVTLSPVGLNYANIIGFVEDVVGATVIGNTGTGMPEALTGPVVRLRCIEMEEAGATLAQVTLAGSTNNLSPLGTYGIAMMSQLMAYVLINPGGSAQTITGMMAGRPWQQMTLINTSTSNGQDLTLPNNSASSTAGNRWINANEASITLHSQGMLDVVYDPIAAGWRPLVN